MEGFNFQQILNFLSILKKFVHFYVVYFLSVTYALFPILFIQYMYSRSRLDLSDY